MRIVCEVHGLEFDSVYQAFEHYLDEHRGENEI